MNALPVIKRGEPCYHIEHANVSGDYIGRYFPSGRVGGEGEWESCPNEPSRGAIARAEALFACYPDWWDVTSWDPAKRHPIKA